MAEYINKADMWYAYGSSKDDVDMAERFVRLPTIDIVHCSECKYWENGTMDLGLDCHTRPDFFCADGERRTE